MAALTWLLAAAALLALPISGHASSLQAAPRGSLPSPKEGQAAEALVIAREVTSARVTERVVERSGAVVDRTIHPATRRMLSSTTVGNVLRMPWVQQRTMSNGSLVRVVRDPSGAVLELTLTPQGALVRAGVVELGSVIAAAPAAVPVVSGTAMSEALRGPDSTQPIPSQTPTGLVPLSVLSVHSALRLSSVARISADPSLVPGRPVLVVAPMIVPVPYAATSATGAPVTPAAPAFGRQLVGIAGAAAAVATNTPSPVRPVAIAAALAPAITTPAPVVPATVAPAGLSEGAAKRAAVTGAVPVPTVNVPIVAPAASPAVANRQRQVASNTGFGVDAPPATAAVGGAATQLLLLAQYRNAAGQLTRRTVDSTGRVMEWQLNAGGQSIAGRYAADVRLLPLLREHRAPDGGIVRLVRDATGAVLELRFAADGRLSAFRVLEVGGSIATRRAAERGVQPDLFR